MIRNINFKFTKPTLYIILISMVFFVLTYVVGSYVTKGDQVSYQSYYHHVKTLSLILGYKYMIARLDAKEPIYFLITWLGAHVGIGKLLLMSFVNGLLVFSLLSYLRLKKISFFIVFLILGNYYFWGVFLSAERLKFGVLFFIIGMIALEKNYKSWFVFFIISLLSHFQMLILIFCAVWTSFLDNIEKVRAAIYSQDVLTFTFISIILSCLSDVFLNLIYEKILFYHNHNGNTLFNVVKPMAFFFWPCSILFPGRD